MLSQAGDLFDWTLVKKAVAYTLNGVREDGAFPDRVQSDGLSVFSAGQHWVDHADDNVPFGVLLVATYVQHTNDSAFFCQYEPKVGAPWFEMTLHFRRALTPVWRSSENASHACTRCLSPPFAS